MKITNQILSSSVPSLQAMANESLEIEATFTVAESLKKIQEALTTFNKLRQDIVTNKCEKTEEGKPKTLEGHPEQVVMTDAGIADLNKLAELEVDIAIEQMPLSLFKGAKLKPADMTNLLWLIKK